MNLYEIKVLTAENNTVGKTDIDNFLNEAKMIENGSR